MRVKHGGLRAILLVVVAVTAVVLLRYLNRPTVQQVSRPAQKEQPQSNKETPASMPQSVSQPVQRMVDVVNRRLQSVKKSGIVDLDGIMDDLEDNGLRQLKSNEILAVIDAVDFGSPAGDSQWRFLMLEAAAEILRPKTTDQDVAWIDDKLEKATTIEETAKWFKVLEAVGYAGNQAAYIQLLNNLPEQITDEKAHAKAEMVGRILGGIGTENSIRAVLAVADGNSEGKQLAVERAVGYVQDTSAIAAIAEVIDGSESNSRRQVTLATKMLGQIPDEYSVMSLRNLAADSDPEIAQTAARSLALLLQNNPGLKSVTN